MARTRYRNEDRPIPLRELPASALRAVLREGYGKRELREDVLAGVVVGVVALPLAMALGIAIGVPPQHGLYTAIVAGFVVALLGGSRMQVSGPTAAFIVILAPIVTRFGLGGLLVAGLMSGVLLIGMGLLRLGGLIRYIPHPVTTGFTAGIATVIATLQLKDLFGLRPSSNPEHYVERVASLFSARSTVSWPAFAIGALTLAVLMLWPRLTRRVPAALVALPVAALATLALQRLWPGASIETIASRFTTEVGGVQVGGIPRVPPLPMWPWTAPGANGAALSLSFETLRALLPSAFAIAMLGAIESLLSAVVADAMARTRHDPDAELIALGTGNVLAPFFGGIPATGALARTATNVRSGARSPIAAMVHALTVLAAVLLLAPAIGYLPMSGLAALLLLVAWNMSEVRHFAHTVSVAPRSDVAVLLICYVLTVLVDMVAAVSVGVVLAALLFMRRMAATTAVQMRDGEHATLPRAVPPGVVVYDITGPLFFGAAQKAMNALDIVGRAKVVILRLDDVPFIDATGLVALESAVRRMRELGCLTILVGLQAQPAQVLDRSLLSEDPNTVKRCADSETALRWADAFLARASDPALRVSPAG